MTDRDPGQRRARGLLVAGMLAGMAAAAGTLVTGGSGTVLPEDAAARVNDHLISRDAWLRAVAAVASERRTPLTAADQRHILDRLVDEELLVQHGLALGLAERDRRLRGQLVGEVLVAATAAIAEPDEAELRAFYETHRDRFTTPGRLRVAATRADGAPLVPPVPDALLPPAKLREYVGPRLTEAALRLETGRASAPLPGAGSDVILRVLEREPPHTPAFEVIREEVRAEVRRRAEEAAVRRLLDDLRRGGDVVVRTDAP